MSCLERDDTIPELYWGTALVEFNDEQKDLFPYCDMIGAFLNITLDDYNPHNLREYQLVFGHIEPKVYTIDSLVNFKSVGVNEAEFTSLASIFPESGIIGNIYKPLETEDNVLEITDWDPSTGEVTGKFHVIFVRDLTQPWGDHSRPDTIRLVNGEFHTRV